MNFASINAASTAGQQIPLHCLLRAVPTSKMKSAREISLRAQLCDDLKMRQGEQHCQSSSMLWTCSPSACPSLIIMGFYHCRQFQQNLVSIEGKNA